VASSRAFPLTYRADNLPVNGSLPGKGALGPGGNLSFAISESAASSGGRLLDRRRFWEVPTRRTPARPESIRAADARASRINPFRRSHIFAGRSGMMVFPGDVAIKTRASGSSWRRRAYPPETKRLTTGAPDTVPVCFVALRRSSAVCRGRSSAFLTNVATAAVATAGGSCQGWWVRPPPAG
jgi:hypothetical protein